MNPIRPALTLLLASIACGQVYIVNALGGPGVGFTSIATAAAAVPSGSVLLVQPGIYTSFSIVNKSLSVLGQPGVVIQNAGVTILGTTAVQRVVVRDLELADALGIVVCNGCDGPILLDGIRASSATSLTGAYLRLNQCDQVLARDCQFRGGFGVILVGLPAIQVDASRLCMLGGSASGFLGGALAATASDIQVVSAVLTAGSNHITASLGSSQVRLLGATSIIHNGTSLAINGGNVRIAPGVTIVGPTQAGSSTAIDDEHVMTTGGALGATVDATMVGASGSLGVLFLGVPNPAWFLPGVVDSWWLHPVEAAAVAVAMFGGPTNASVNVPPTPTLRGQMFGFQGLYLQPAMTLTASNPAWFVLR